MRKDMSPFSFPGRLEPSHLVGSLKSPRVDPGVPCRPLVPLALPTNVSVWSLYTKDAYTPLSPCGPWSPLGPLVPTGPFRPLRPTLTISPFLCKTFFTVSRGNAMTVLTLNNFYHQPIK
ncbi:hypothetical protein 74L [Ranavirus ambystoma1]|uniref:Uncharacterized protein n=2 Tax=Ranavirus ambystoma1 TaxID=265294 RepID=A0A0U2R6M8_9VIRU|nr:hypothetical protein ATVp66 [Ambystoma tigrinum virus]AAP33243.1 unknown [Ambystoma tigrinum stebbensi virus]ALN36558.1 hypothetical protein 63L [Ambystoma tigrinum virus]QBL14674.1 hypothetical protein 75L [Ambystoma tigrinum virus]QBL14782.1 hypothetical protein 74L [Ambystoma tigrinum virus]QBL14890.1 hypothetical protein 74L [Ambystoma tigrinum virus]